MTEVVDEKKVVALLEREEEQGEERVRRGQRLMRTLDAAVDEEGQSLTEFEPTDWMRAIVRVMQEADYDITIKAACEEAGIARQTWYDNQENVAWATWFALKREAFWKFKLTEVDRATFNGATGKGAAGNTADRRLMYERHDDRFAPRSRQEATVSQTTEHSLSVESADRLIRRLEAQRQLSLDTAESTSSESD